MDINYLKKRLDHKFAKYDFTNDEDIISRSVLNGKVKYEKYFLKNDLIFLDVSNSEPIGFAYDRILCFKENSENEVINFEDVVSVEIDNHKLFSGEAKDLAKAKSSIKNLIINKSNGEILNLEVAGNGIPSVYKELIDLAVFIFNKDW